MTFAKIRCFVAVGDNLNFTRAAEELFISQQVVRRQVAGLEKDLGLTLLDRTTKSVRLTAAGEVLHAAWKRLLAESDAAVREAETLQEEERKKLRVGIADVHSLVELMHGGIENFTERYPGVELEYQVYTFRRLRDMLRGGEVDVILSLSTEVRDIEPLQMFPLRRLQLSIILSKRHPLHGKKHLTVKDLAGETLYFFSPAFSYDVDKNLRGIFQHEGVSPDNVRYFDSVHTLELALLSGKGITITFNIFFPDSAGNLIFHDISHYLQKGGDELKNSDEWAVAAWQDEKNRHIPRFIDCIKDEFKKKD